MGCSFVILPQPVCGRAAPRVERGTKPAAGSALACPPYPTRSHLCCERRRGLASPDDGDALALTFAYPVAKRA
jgi:hypothetical protein